VLSDGRDSSEQVRRRLARDFYGALARLEQESSSSQES
jgi:hypothetical protein